MTLCRLVGEKVCLTYKRGTYGVGTKQRSKNFSKVRESLFLTQKKVDVKLSFSKWEIWAEAMRKLA